MGFLEVALCKCDKTLAESHILPKMFFDYIKNNSITGRMRSVDCPNKPVQDGVKVPLMCYDCEELFSGYETYFKNKIYTKTIENDGNICFDSNDDELSYFMLSVAWRIMVYIMEKDTSSFTAKEKNKINEVINEWRKWLITKQFDKIRKVQQFIIPTKELKIFQKIKYDLGERGFQVNDRRIRDTASFDCRTFDEKDTFEFGFTIAQVPYFVFITSMLGQTSSMKQYQLGNKIKPYKSDLPKNISTILYDNHFSKFLKADDELSDKQRESINKRIAKYIPDNKQ